MAKVETLLSPKPPAIKTVFIANGREFFSPIDRFVPKAHKAEFIQTDNDETDPMIFEHGDDKIVFVPQQIDKTHIHDIATLFGMKNSTIVMVPGKGEGLSKDILHNKKVLSTIEQIIEESGPEVQVVPWGHTSQFHELHNALRQKGLQFKTPETPLDKAEWHPDYANTKLGTREILKRVQITHPELDIHIPEGFPCPDLDSALRIAKYFAADGRGIALKANLGAAGVGVFVFSPKEYNLSTTEGWNAMVSKIQNNELLKSGPVIVEEYILPDFTKRGVFPSVDTLIKPDGTVEIQAVSAMGIHRDGNELEFYGSTMGHGLFTKEQDAYMRAINNAVGEEHAKLGYRGWFDTDFILAADGKLYLTETNVRRTGTTYMVDLAKRLFGDNWENQMAMIANDKYIRPHLSGVSHTQLKETVSDLLYPIKGQKRGIILTQAMRTMLKRGKFAYAAIGTTQEDAENIENALASRLG